MNRNELRKADIHLMIVFEALMHERSLSRVAGKLSLGQPAISAVLSRLRVLFDDPLFVRVGNQMTPTARAEEINQHLTPALDALSNALSLAHDFDPATSALTFRIGLSDDVEFGLLPPLLRALREEAPDVVVVVLHADYWRIPEMLASGEITVGISQTRTLPANAKRKTLRRMRAVVLRADKPTKPLTLEEYCSRPHVVVSHTAATKGIADEYLDAIGRTRKVVLSVPQFNSLPAIIAGTNLLAACPDYAAKTLEDWGSLYAEPLPFDLPPLELNMVWLAMTDTDPAELWIRCRLQEHMSEGC